MNQPTAPPRVKLRQERVWDLLNRRNMSQNELARLARISSGYLSQLISGKKSPSPAVRRRLQAALGVSEFDDLFLQEKPDDRGE